MYAERPSCLEGHQEGQLQAFGSYAVQDTVRMSTLLADIRDNLFSVPLFVITHFGSEYRTIGFLK